MTIMIKVGVNGYGTIGKRVADAVSRQNDMKLVGVTKRSPDFGALLAVEKGYLLYSLQDRKKFNDAGIKTEGTLEDLLREADVIVDGTPENSGYKPLYEKYGRKAIWQGGEEHEIAGLSFNAYANYEKALGARYVRVVSCNTTGLIRTLYPLEKEFGIGDAYAVLIRRGADPPDTKKGPINAIEPELEVPSHHGPDVQTILPQLNICTTAVKVPTTLMHLHSVKVNLKKPCKKEDIINTWRKYSRIKLLSESQKVNCTGKIMEYAKDLGRSRGDLYEIAVWESGITVLDKTLYYFQAVHQEADVVPENIDAIRAMFKLETNAYKSIEKTDRTLGIGLSTPK